MAKTPGFLRNGIDFGPFTQYYRMAPGNFIVIDDPEEIAVSHALAQHVIKTSYGYSDINQDDERLQYIFNSELMETKLAKVLKRRSNSVWLIGGQAEGGTDFESNDGLQIEAKMYKDVDRMLEFAKKASASPAVFHTADYVIVYLKNSYKRTIPGTNLEESTHWVWLHRDADGNYVEYYDEALEAQTKQFLPDTLPVCYFKYTADNKLIVGKSKFCT